MKKRLLALLLGSAVLSTLSPALAKDTGYLFISSEKDNSIMVMDSGDFSVIKVIPTADRPRHMAFNADHSLIYAACGDGESIDIIDVARLEVTDRIEDIDDPEAFDLSPDGGMMYLSLEDEGALGFIDLASKALVAEVEVGEEPEGVLTGPDGKTVYVTSEVANTVHLVDTANRELKANIVVGKRPRRFALTPDNLELWVTSELDASVSIINLADNTVREVIRFEPKGFRREQVTPVGIVMTADGRGAWVALGRSNHVAYVDVASRKVEDYILVGNRAWNVTLNRDESRLYVVNGLSDDPSVIDTGSRKVIRS
nr:PQQ-dependent catabolism-associated beta-propeller protein [Thiolinea sp.]